MRRSADDAAFRTRAGRYSGISAEKPSELEQLDDLIADCLAACKEGQSLETKRNPAFSNLESLMPARKMILAGHRPLGENDSRVILNELDRVLSQVDTECN